MAATGLEDMQGVGRSIDVRQSRDELAPKSTATVSPGVTTTIRIIPTFQELQGFGAVLNDQRVQRTGSPSVAKKKRWPKGRPAPWSLPPAL